MLSKTKCGGGGNHIDMTEQSSCAIHKKFLPVSIFCACQSGECYIQNDCIHTTYSTFNTLNLGSKLEFSH